MAHQSAGWSGKHYVRAMQWVVGVPIVYSFAIALLQVEWPDPALWLFMTVTGVQSPWWGHVWMGAFTFFIEISDKAIVMGENDEQLQIHEIVKNIGDRLRAGAAVETSVAEAIRTAKGPAAAFEHAIELSDSMPFELALRESGDECGNPYLQEVLYLMAEAVGAEGDTGGAVRRLGVELERNHQYAASVASKLSTPLAVLRVIAFFAVPPLYALLRAAFYGFKQGGIQNLEPAATLFFLYGAIGITIYDGIIFGQWERLFARMPLAFGAIYLGLTWI